MGLGNPGEKYELTRHNVGFLVIDALAGRFKVDQKDVHVQKKITSWFEINDEINLVCAKPLTYMNDSGRSSKFLTNKFGIEIGNIVAIHDDLDLPLGKIRLKKGGSSGGHQGINSIVKYMGSNDFYRVRIGIGRPNGRKDPADFVLEDFKKDEITEIEFAVQRAADAILDLIKTGLEAAMSKYN